MENYEAGKTNLLSTNALHVDGSAANNWKASGGWAKAIAITLTVGIGIVILGMVVLFTNDRNTRLLLGSDESAFLVIAIIIVLLALAVVALMTINLLRFGNGINVAVNNMDQLAFEKSMTGLRNYFIIGGIVGILTVLYTLIDIFK